MSKVFVSYKRADKDKVFPIVSRMESELGFKFWIDLKGIESDEQFTRVIINAINECEVFLFMYSKTHETIIDTERDFTVRELYFAHSRYKHIVFIETESCKLPDWFDFNFPQKQVVQANDNRAMDKLVHDIRQWLYLSQQNSSLNYQVKTTDSLSVSKEISSHSQAESIDVNKPHPQAIDLDLPSGTKWASCNVGATKPEEFGGYFAWGEIEEKKIYNETTYIYWDGDIDSCNYLGRDISGMKYDVAHMKWGGGWRIPSEGDFQELFVNCHHEWSTLNGINGLMITSKINGNSIFLPAAGYRYDEYLGGTGSNGKYWLSNPYLSSSSLYAFRLNFHSDGAFWFGEHRIYGMSVRPVSK